MCSADSTRAPVSTSVTQARVLGVNTKPSHPTPHCSLQSAPEAMTNELSRCWTYAVDACSNVAVPASAQKPLMYGALSGWNTVVAGVVVMIVGGGVGAAVWAMA